MTNTRLLSIYLLLLAFTASFLAGNLHAQDITPETVRVDQEDSGVAVLQKRFFLKAWRPEIGMLAGGFLNEAYTDTTITGFRISIFANEWAGLELSSSRTSIEDSADKSALDKLKFKKANPKDNEDPDALVSPEPEINNIHQANEASLIFTPFYGKLNLMDLAIIYMDTYLSAGIAKLDTDQGNKNAISFAVGQRYYVHKNISLRLDFKNYSFQETRAQKNSRRNQQAWTVGLSFFVW